MPRTFWLPMGPADVQRWLEEEREASGEYDRWMNIYFRGLAGFAIVALLVSVLVLGAVGWSFERVLIANLCAAYECRGNAPGECPLPPDCPKR